MTTSKTKLILAKEYLFFLKSITISTVIFFAINLTIWSVNQYRKSLAQQRDIVVLKIDSLENSKGSSFEFERVQLSLYNFIHEPEYYTKSYEDFKIQYSSDSSSNKLYNKMVESEIFKGDYNLFRNQYYPTIDKRKDSEITSFKIQKTSFDNRNFNFISFISWKVGLLFWALIFYVIRLMYLSIKKSKRIISLDKNGT